MSRERWIWDAEQGKVVRAEEYQRPASAGPMVSRDIAPYPCPITGKMIDGRRDHRENLKRNDCHIVEKGEREHAERTRKQEFSDNIDRVLQRMN